MIKDVKNIFAGTAASGGAEQFTTLFENSTVKIERIVSHSHSSAEGFWYDQSEDEWVIVLRGLARLEFSDGKSIEMKEGDYLLIPRHVRHRVGQTSAETIWLALHVK
jgi:cupin 2 domain-containing protein